MPKLKTNAPRKIRTELTDVTLTTWGTHPHAGNGMAHFLDAKLFGGNIGHAALTVTFPADQKGVDLIEKYCFKDGESKPVIPFERKLQNAMTKEGKVEKVPVFTVYFSWWPGELSQNLNEDGLLERSGVHFGNVNPRFSRGEDPLLESRTTHGVLGNKRVSLAPISVEHRAGLTPEVIKMLELETKLELTSQKIQSANVLAKKIDPSQKNLKTVGSLSKLLDAHIPDWRNQVQNTAILANDEIKKFSEILEKTKQNYDKEYIEINQEKKDIKNKVKERHTKTDFQNLKDTLNLLPQDIKQKYIKEENSAFSKPIWLKYHIEEIYKKDEHAQELGIQFLSTDFSDEESKNKLLDMLFENKIPEEKNPEIFQNWRQYLPENLKNIQKNEMTLDVFKSVRTNIQNERRFLSDQLLELEAKQLRFDQIYSVADPALQASSEKLTKGLSPDVTISLPASRENTPRDKQKLNIEPMLAQMRKLVDNEKFHTMANNCSDTVGSILASGAPATQKHYFNRKAWGGFGNPQEVLNGAMQYQDNFYRKGGKAPLREKISKINILNAPASLSGKMLHGIVSPKVPIPAKVGLGAAIIPTALVAGTIQTLKGLADPKATFEKSSKFTAYAWKKDSIFLKVCSIPVAVVAGIFAAPAQAQRGIEAGIKQLRKADAATGAALNRTSKDVQKKESPKPTEAPSLQKLSALLESKPEASRSASETKISRLKEANGFKKSNSEAAPVMLNAYSKQPTQPEKPAAEKPTEPSTKRRFSI